MSVSSEGKHPGIPPPHILTHAIFTKIRAESNMKQHKEPRFLQITRNNSMENLTHDTFLTILMPKACSDWQMTTTHSKPKVSFTFGNEGKKKLKKMNNFQRWQENYKLWLQMKMWADCDTAVWKEMLKPNCHWTELHTCWPEGPEVSLKRCRMHVIFQKIT